MTSQKPLLSAIIVLNAKYFPSTKCSAAKVGATSFAFSVIKVFQDARLFNGMILYERDEGLEYPSAALELRESLPCVKLSFNFNMPASDIQRGIAVATELLAAFRESLCMLYYQTDTLLAYHPKWLPCSVTHHGPFYQDFTKHFSPNLAAIAFQGHEKAQHLKLQQELGINYLIDNSNVFVLQHSQLQRNYLITRGIHSSRIRKLSPPIQRMGSRLLECKLSQLPFIKFQNPQRLLLFTAVARIDFFKNIDLIVEAGVELLQRGLPINVFVAGGDHHDEALRHALLQDIPIAFAPYFKVVPKLAKDELYSLFLEARSNGIFVCPSRFETLGITPLEAALSGVTTIITDSQLVEASTYFPAENRFSGGASGLADVVQRFAKDGIEGGGEKLRERMEMRISLHNFRTDLLSGWSEFSRAAVGSGTCGV